MIVMMLVMPMSMSMVMFYVGGVDDLVVLCDVVCYHSRLYCHDCGDVQCVFQVDGNVGYGCDVLCRMLCMIAMLFMLHDAQC